MALEHEVRVRKHGMPAGCLRQSCLDQNR
jgi:hypothetical protein